MYSYNVLLNGRGAGEERPGLLLISLSVVQNGRLISEGGLKERYLHVGTHFDVVHTHNSSTVIHILFEVLFLSRTNNKSFTEEQQSRRSCIFSNFKSKMLP